MQFICYVYHIVSSQLTSSHRKHRGWEHPNDGTVLRLAHVVAQATAWVLLRAAVGLLFQAMLQINDWLQLCRPFVCQTFVQVHIKHMSSFTYVFIYICLHIYIYISSYIHMYICTYIYIYIHIYIYTHVHIYIHSPLCLSSSVWCVWCFVKANQIWSLDFDNLYASKLFTIWAHFYGSLSGSTEDPHMDLQNTWRTNHLYILILCNWF